METVRRGYIPSDEAEFGTKAEAKLRAAGEELCFLLNRGLIEEEIPGAWVLRLGLVQGTE